MLVGTVITKLARDLYREILTHPGMSVCAGFGFTVFGLAAFFHVEFPALVPELTVSSVEVLAHRGEILSGQSDISKVSSFHFQFQ
jgi:hypothetical protein